MIYSDITVGIVQDMSKILKIRNTEYMTFPYIMYKVNDLLKMDNVVKEYKNYLYEENSEARYLVFKYSHDIKYIDAAIFGNEGALTFDNIQNHLSFEQQKILSKFNKKDIIFIKD